MQTIRTRLDIEALLNDFENIAQYDSSMQKWYFVFNDYERAGIWTLMKKEELWTIHGKGSTYCDLYEQELDNETMCRFLWKHRKAINHELRQMVLI